MVNNVSFTSIPTPPLYLNPPHFIFSEYHRVQISIIKKITYNVSEYKILNTVFKEEAEIHIIKEMWKGRHPRKPLIYSFT